MARTATAASKAKSSKSKTVNQRVSKSVRSKSKSTKAVNTTPLTNQETQHSFPLGFSAWVTKVRNYKPNKRAYIGILIVGLVILALLNKDWFVAATVNGSPISNFELQNRLNQQFRTDVLNQMINEKIILDEARKQNSLATESQIDERILELEQNVGGAEVLDNLLVQQNQTRITLRDQLRLQLSIANLYDKEATVSAEEIASFLEQNRASLEATEEAEQEKEVVGIIKQQKLGEIFSQKFQELRQKANIKIF